MVARPPPVPFTVFVGDCEVNVEAKLKLLGPRDVEAASWIPRQSMPALKLCLPTNLVISALKLVENCTVQLAVPPPKPVNSPVVTLGKSGDPGVNASTDAGKP